MNRDRYRDVARAGLAPNVLNPPKAPDWEDIAAMMSVKNIPQRRNPGWLIALASAMIVVLLVGLAAILPRGNPLPNPAAGAPGTGEPTSSTLPDSTLDETPARGTEVTFLALDRVIPLQILAVRPNSPSLVLLDLERGTSTVYPPGVNALPLDAIDGAVMTPGRELVIWTQGVARVFEGSLDQVDSELKPDPLRNLASFAPALQVIPTAEGGKAWLVQPGIRATTGTYPTLIELVEISGGRRLLAREADTGSYPVAVTATGLVLNTERLLGAGDEREADLGSQRVVHLREDGTITEVGPGRAIAATSATIVRLVCPSTNIKCELRTSDTNGSDERVIDQPFEGDWASVGGPVIPSDAMPLSVVSPDGTELLIAIGQNIDAYSAPDQYALFVVDLEEGSARQVAESLDPFPLATWSRDGRWIALFDDGDLLLIDATDIEVTISLKDLIPKDHFPLAAGGDDRLPELGKLGECATTSVSVW